MKNLINDFKDSYDYSNRDYLYERKTVKFLSRYSWYFMGAFAVCFAIILIKNLHA